jgi:AcrR family transcriptional regulator
VNKVHFVNVIHKTTFEPRARRREDKTEAILDAAMRLLAEGGLEGVTLQKVASELGIVTTALYRYFASKDALVAALQRRAVSTMHAHFTTVRSELDPKRLSPEVAALTPLLALARAYVALPETHPETFRLVAILLGDPRRLVSDEEAAKNAPLVAAMLGDMQALFVEAERAMALTRGPALQRTLVLWATLHGLTQLEKLRRLAPDAPTARQLCDEAACAILRGFGADASRLTRAKHALEHGDHS